MTLQFVLSCILYFFYLGLGLSSFLRYINKKGSGDRADLMPMACDLNSCFLVPCILVVSEIAYFFAYFPDLEVYYKHCP